MPSNPIRGAAFMLEGLRLITRPGLRRFFMIPLLVNIGVFAGAIWYGLSRFEGALGWIALKLPNWLHWLDWLLWPIVVLALLIIVFYSFTLVANLIASPFNGILAEKAEAILTGRSLDEPIDSAKILEPDAGMLEPLN